MSKQKIAGYGSWKSPIDARRIAEGTIRLMEVMVQGPAVFWAEMRPAEGGRYVVVRRDPDGATTDMIPAEFSARTRVHEYGGGAFLPCGEAVVLANFADQMLYRTDGTGRPQRVTDQQNVRHADFVCDKRRSRLIAVQEDHRGDGEAVNSIVAVHPHDEREPQVLVSGNDFYSSPQLSPDGSKLAYLTWNHPDMPWDAAELWVAQVGQDGSLDRGRLIAGGRGESVAQPRWSPEGVLHLVSDRSNWWNLYRAGDGQVEPLAEMEAEFASPQWIFGMSNYDFDGPGRIICSYTQGGRSHLAALDTATGQLEEIPTPYSAIASLHVTDGRVAFIGGAPDRPTAVVLLDLAGGKVEELRRSSDLAIDPGYISIPEAVEFPTTGGLTAHGLFYEPRNKKFAGPADQKPPLVVMVHGGPTSATTSAQRLSIQYYTSRGIAVLDVNYGGSTGYGRQYRERLRGQWGVVDVDDSCNGAKYLAARGSVDGSRMAITGGSAGGYTTLSCLAFRDTFAAGSSHYGVSDCERLATETHKFESRYLDGLIGPYPERRDLYLERSAIHHVDGFSCPVAFFQGLEDKVVPPNQARLMADALRKKRLPVVLVEFEGEQHGFRKAENIRRAMEGELYFFSRIFGFEPAEAIEPLEIENL